MPSLLLVLKRHCGAAVLTLASVVGASLVYLALSPPRYESSARLIVDPRQVSISELGQSLTNTAGPSADTDPIATQAELVKSQRVLKQALSQLAQQTNSADSLPTLQELDRHLKVKILPATSILELSYEGGDPQLVANLLNAIAEVTVKENSEAIRLQASSVRQFLESRVPQQSARLEAAEARESQYRERSGLVSFDAQTDSLVRSLAEVEGQERTVTNQLQEAAVRSNLMQQVTGVSALQNAYAAIRAGQDRQLLDLQQKLSDLEAEVIAARSRLGDQHPDLLAAVEKRDEMRKLYAERLTSVIPGNQAVSPSTAATDEASRQLITDYILGEVERAALQSSVKNMQTERTRLQTRIRELPAKQQQLTMLIRQREQEAETLKLLQSKLEEAQIAEAQLVSNVRPLDLAEAATEPKQQVPIALAVALISGLILGTGVILLLESMDNKLRSATEAEGLLKLPLLGLLPRQSVPSNFKQVERFLDDPASVEPYRVLLKTLEHRSQGNLNAILVSSTLPEEGKSNVAVHLASVAAMLSRRTLLINADLRYPAQHRLFHSIGQPGLTDVVAGETTLLQAIQSTSLEHLQVLTHGQVAQRRPSMVSESPAMKALIVEAATHYDLVVIDTSPISTCADAMTLSQYTDGLLMVMRPDCTPKRGIVRSVAELRASGANILGLVSTETADRVDRLPFNLFETSQPPLILSGHGNGHSNGNGATPRDPASKHTRN